MKVISPELINGNASKAEDTYAKLLKDQKKAIYSRILEENFQNP